MITTRLFIALAASSLAGLAYAQTQPAPSNQPNAPPGYNAQHPHQREMKSAGPRESSSPNNRSAPGSGLNTAETGSMASAHSRTAPGSTLNTPASSRRNHSQAMKMASAGPAGGHSWSNMPVQTPSGQSLGSVSRVIPGLNGRPSSGYVLVSGAHGMSVPVSYRTAESMVRDGKLVLQRSRFEHAPKVTQEDLQNPSDHAWRVKADRYWTAKGHGRMHR
jgi:Ni/Co efflux regulator RcnB